MSRDTAIAAAPTSPAVERRITRANVGLYLLADHLDAALAAGEDLLACTLTVGAPHSGMAPDDIRAEQAELRTFMERVRGLEMALVARVLQARRRATELPRIDDAHVLMLNLLLAGTEGLGAAVREVGDRVEQQFLTGTGHLAYLRSRGFLQPEAACLGAIADLRVTEAFLVYGRLPLGGLLDLVAAFLDKLDLVFDLYPEPQQDASAEPVDETAVAARMHALQAAARLHASEAVLPAGEAPLPIAQVSEGAAPEASDTLAASRNEADPATSETAAADMDVSLRSLADAEVTAAVSIAALSLAEALAQARAQSADQPESLTDRISRVAQDEGGPVG